jgi:hypothetical protein
MGIFEPLIEHTHYKPPEPRHRRDVVAVILLALLAVWLLAVVLLVWLGTDDTALAASSFPMGWVPGSL